jgi:beta-aspartyl-peptidase (threonine type)
MRKTILFIFSAGLIFWGCQTAEQPAREFVLVIHGGAGVITRENMPEEREKMFTDTLTYILKAGYEILQHDGSSLDAVETVIKLMEDSPILNAGRGAVFANSGKNELDASIMEGKTGNAGAVASVLHVKNPIALARIVMEKSPHLLFVRDGAEQFAREQGMELVDQSYFFTQRSWDRLQRQLEKENEKSSAEPVSRNETFFTGAGGTVGAVALDKSGNLAAGTSTGGMSNKKSGRVGDSPIIGAGTYASNKTCAVSATGHGEYFIRGVLAYDVSALMEYRNLSLEQAAHMVIHEKLEGMGARGGLIAVDTKGNFTMPFNTEGMYRGYILEDGKTVVKMFREETQNTE